MDWRLTALMGSVYLLLVVAAFWMVRSSTRPVPEPLPETAPLPVKQVAEDAFAPELTALLAMTKTETQRLRNEKTRAICKTHLTDYICGTLKPDQPNVLLIGDSFGLDGTNIITAGFPDTNLLVDILGGCPLLLDVSVVTHSKEECQDYNLERFAQIEQILPDIDSVVLSIKITKLRYPGFKDTIDWFVDRDVNLIVLGTGPRYTRKHVSEVIIEHGRVEGLNQAVEAIRSTNIEWINDELEPYLEARGGTYIRKLPFFCPQKTSCNILVDGYWPIILDRTHLTRGAADAFGRHLGETHPDLLSYQRP